MTDPRVPDPGEWPWGVGVVYRHFGAADRERHARELRERFRVMLVGDDPELAEAVGADGVHFRRDAEVEGPLEWRSRQPDWLITAAVVKEGGYTASLAPVDALLVSSVFPSRSPSAGTPLGVEAFRKRARELPVPVYALGGVHAGNIGLLPPGIAGVAGVSFGEPPMDDQLVVEKHVNGPDIRFTATHPDYPGLTAELDLKGAGEGEYAATHTLVPREMEGKGVGSAMYRAMASDARENDYRIVPVCPFIVAKAKRDKSNADIFRRR